MENSYFKKAEIGAWLSIAAYMVLSAIKLIMSQIGNSEALRADGLNNLTDIIASVAVLIGLKISQKPPDENHRYGHSRAETIASLVAAFIMITVGIQVIMDSVQSFFNPKEATPDLMTAFVALFSALFMYGIYRYNLNLSKKINSKALRSAAQDNRSDALVSVGAAIGIARFGEPLRLCLGELLVEIPGGVLIAGEDEYLLVLKFSGQQCRRCNEICLHGSAPTQWEVGKAMPR